MSRVAAASRLGGFSSGKRAAENRSSRERSASRPAAPAAPDRSGPDSYWTRSESPLTGLAFLLPLLVLYEWGTRHYAQSTIIAFSLLQRFCSLLNARDSLILPIAVVVTLLGWHIAKRDPLRVVPSDLFIMVFESAILAIPLLVLWFAASPLIMRWTLCSSDRAALRCSSVIPCIGAGIYEEFMFRLVGLSLLSFIFLDVLQLAKPLALALMVLSSAIAFSAYHYLGYEAYSSPTFIFRVIAGVYFAAVFICRGYAVSCGTHASYDIIVVLLQVLR